MHTEERNRIERIERKLMWLTVTNAVLTTGLVITLVMVVWLIIMHL